MEPPIFMAPEVDGTKGYSFEADLYSLGKLILIS